MTQGLPEVPDTLPALAAEHTATVTPGWPLVRIHDLAGRFPREYHEPRWFGPHPEASGQSPIRLCKYGPRDTPRSFLTAVLRAAKPDGAEVSAG